jgi:hypothetical protein
MKLTIGMASYNNFTEVWFTVQSLLMYQDMTDTEILVIDNYGDTRLKNFIDGTYGTRYILYTEKTGTSAPRDLVFREALGDWVMCIDTHVLLTEGAMASFKGWTSKNPDCKDLLQGPLKYDDLVNYADAFNDEWASGMWGTWRAASIDPNSEPYEIPMQGLGLFACRKDAWLGFNPDFAGFGGEEGYIHSKYRKAGHKTLCLPFLSWVHLFKTGMGDIPYPMIYDDRIRNYVIGFTELGLDLAPVKEHFGADRVNSIATQLTAAKDKNVKLEIIEASYGGANVTANLKRLVRGSGLNVCVNNSLAGWDPQEGILKHLVVKYKLDDVEYSKVIPENDYLIIPEGTCNRLGIFYTNNNDDNVVGNVLGNLEKVSRGRADILTSTWKTIENNPFPELIAQTQSSNHLNITLQILQLLYRAEATGSYKYVSFLEHDVLYPEGYFDYPDFDGGVIYNTNLKGVCSEGFQDYEHVHDSIPLHQMTMLFSDAIGHFESKVKEALLRGQVMLEPDLVRVGWGCINSSVHINHGKNFTNHCDLYTKEYVSEDSYWGNYKELGIF